MFKLEKTGGPYGMGECGYEITNACDFTVKEFIDEVLKEKNSDGTIMFCYDGSEIAAMVSFESGKSKFYLVPNHILKQKVIRAKMKMTFFQSTLSNAIISYKVIL